MRPASRARYVWRGGGLSRFPLSFVEAIRAVARAYLVLADPAIDPARQTLEQWGRRHLGEAALRFLLTPFVRGIYGARPSEIQVALAFPSLAVPRGHSLASWFFRRWHLRIRGLLDKGQPKRPRAEMVAPVRGWGP